MIAEQRRHLQAALRQYAPLGEDGASIRERLTELDRVMSLALLAAIEGMLMQELGRSDWRFTKVLQDLRDSSTEACNEAISDLQDALKYRDYLAHGRRWDAEVNMNYAFDDLYWIAAEVFWHVLGIEL